MKRFLLLLIIVAGNLTLYAQNISVKGVVTDEAGNTLPGATVTEKGVANGKVTDNNGAYEIRVKSDAILVFSYIGSITTERAVKGRSVIHVKLADDNKNLNEVVVIGYGEVKRKDLTGAVSSIKGTELSKVPVQNVASALQGRIAGMQVAPADGTPGSQPAITIRGGGSITQSNEPLYVVDGIPQTDGLSFLDPMDIESVDVLKDASATSIYGARGANGVILITTKQPKAGKLTINYDMYYGAKKVTKEIPVLNPYQYTLLQYERALATATELDRYIKTFGDFSQRDALYAGKPGISWQDLTLGNTANSQYHKVSISGGSSETRFNLFYSHNNDEGVMVNSSSDKDVMKLTVNHNLGKKLKVNGIVNYSNQNTYGVGTREGNNRFNQLQNIFQYRPTYGIAGSDDDLINQDTDPFLSDDSGNVLQNPVTNAESQLRSTNNKLLNLSTSLDYELFKGFTYRGLVNLKTSNNKTNMFNDARSMSAKRTNGPNGSIAQADQNGWNYSNTLTYTTKFKKDHVLTVMAGQEQLYNLVQSFSLAASGFPNINLGLDDIAQGSVAGPLSSRKEDDKLFSLFSRANYAYKDRYIFSASFRADGSSKFGVDNKFGYFPSGAFAWRVSDEGFMKNIRQISDLKLRLSYGASGNNRIDNYLSLDLFQSGFYPLNNANVIAVFPNALPNPDLKWETTVSKNLGIDLGLFGQRVQLTVDAYDNRISDLLLNTVVSGVSGFNNMLINVGSTSNKGVEFSLNTVNIKKTDFSWNTNFNIGFNNNKVVSLNKGDKFLLANSGWAANLENDYIVEVGQSVGRMFGYRTNGIYTVDDFDYNEGTKVFTLKSGLAQDPNNLAKPGSLKYIDVNGDGVINADDRSVIGNARPKFTGGLNNNFSYKGFDLSIFINWSYGNDIYNGNLLNNSQLQLNNINTLDYFADRWITVNAAGQRITDRAEMAALNAGKTKPSYNGAGTSLRLYDQMIEDGSFLRINNVSLGYTFPKNWVSRLKMSGARVYVTAYNLHTFTKYSGYDPEVSTANPSRLTPGVDFGAYPRSRSFVAGVNVSF
ncbi:TonB-dependent receptor [Pedobacter sp. MC2016-24]|uniref:SusC/RagA family TonB-linked outer membrane protein n=1 Tax=Pedobacter sp. MC2016-24 TaxID=2780090 RepID=UPI00187F583A|nr:TonB-dependent receptor [Pedobacter sp. MC2016-24]MBE9598518.1 TonB-dependent receptor [Pedobacter sp. MC2016-24]